MGVVADPEPGGPQRAPASASTLPLPFVPATSAPRTRALRVAELAQERPRPPEPEPDPEPAAVGQRCERPPSYVSAEPSTRHSRVSSSS